MNLRPTFKNSSKLKQQVILSGIFLCSIMGICHGIADATAGFLLGSLVNTTSLEQTSWLIIIYNILGFGYQPVAGMYTDKFQCPRQATLLGLLSLLASLVVVGWQPQLAVALAGIGSAAFHVGGGSLALSATPNRTTGQGIFAAPGVVGLAVGGALGLEGYSFTMPLILFLGVMIALVTVIKLPRLAKIEVDKPELPMSEEYDWVMLVLITAIALISTVWTSFQFLLQAHLIFLIALAIAAAIAKILGGIIAEYWGWQAWIVTSLSLAILLLLWGQENPLTLLISLGLLQSTVPITIAATGRMMPNQPATAAGFALGLAILIGGIPVVAGLNIVSENPVTTLTSGRLNLIAALLILTTILSLSWVFQSKVFQSS